MRGPIAMTALLVAALAPSAAAADERPNVVLVVADDLGWADLGCYGSKFYRTPNLDRLAAGGRRFTQAYAACPVCSPTRAAVMTGKWPARLNLTDWLPGRGDMPSQMLNRPVIRQQLPHEEVTLAEALKARGYATGHVGKWHLGGDGFGPTSQGFDLNVAGNASGSPPGYFAPFARGGVPLPGLEDAPRGEYLTDRLAAEAEAFIEAHKAEAFFLYLPHFAVHTPLQAKADLSGGFAKWDGTPHGRQENPIYAAMLQSMDQGVGRVVSALDRAGLTGKTFVVFTSDNGGLATREGPDTPATINAPLREGKGWLYEGGIRVPLIVSRPGMVAPGTEATPVWSADLFPTVAAFCGADAGGPFDGVSLAGLLTKGTPVSPRPLFWHYPHYSNQGGRPGAAVRDGDWKLVEFYENGRRELFDLARDPRESNNLAEKQPAKVDELAAKLARWREAVDARMPTPNPSYSPNPQAGDGTITLPARTAEVHGVMLRYEPLPHKNTLGFWTRADDWASWEFEVKTPGTFKVEALVGCGKGSGGSVVEFRVGGDVLKSTVAETGGFQAFQIREFGKVTLKAKGRARLEVRAVSKPGPAVMDLREVRLTPEQSAGVAVSPEPLTHAYLATGESTYVRDGRGAAVWTYPHPSRDGWILPNGNRLLALSKSEAYPGGAAVEVTPDGKTVFEFRGTQSEVNTVQAVGADRYLVTEAGARPRLLEVDAAGKVVVEVPLKAQTTNHHLQTRMARKLENGHYLVPQLLDKVVREYTADGEVVWEVKTPDMPFTAIRLDDGNTLIGCTLGNLVIEVDSGGKIAWKVDNDDLPGRPINDACGVQRLPNGNTVICSHHARGDEVMLTEVTRAKQVVWTLRDAKSSGIHHVQILDTNGEAISGRPLR